MGMFSKEATQTSPAMQQYNSNVDAQVSHYVKTVMPLQAFYTEQNNADRAGLQDMAEGQQTNAASLQAGQISGALTAKREQQGAGEGSGAYTAEIENGGELDAAARSSGITQADLEAKQSYLQAVQKAMTNENTSAQIAMGGLGSAANQEQQEAQLTADIDNSRQAMVGQISTALVGAGIQHMGGGGAG